MPAFMHRLCLSAVVVLAVPLSAQKRQRDVITREEIQALRDASVRSFGAGRVGVQVYLNERR